MYSRGLGVVMSNTDMDMGPNFSTQPNPYLTSGTNSITLNTGCYNAINRETIITSLKKLFSQHGTDFSINTVTLIQSETA